MIMYQKNKDTFAFDEYKGITTGSNHLSILNFFQEICLTLPFCFYTCFSKSVYRVFFFVPL